MSSVAVKSLIKYRRMWPRSSFCPLRFNNDANFVPSQVDLLAEADQLIAWQRYDAFGGIADVVKDDLLVENAGSKRKISRGDQSMSGVKGQTGQ